MVRGARRIKSVVFRRVFERVKQRSVQSYRLDVMRNSISCRILQSTSRTMDLASEIGRLWGKERTLSFRFPHIVSLCRTLQTISISHHLDNPLCRFENKCLFDNLENLPSTWTVAESLGPLQLYLCPHRKTLRSEPFEVRLGMMSSYHLITMV
jgi:hypothetical protein